MVQPNISSSSITELVNISKSSHTFINWLCYNGTVPSMIDLTHMLMFPYMSNQHKPRWINGCRASQEFSLSSKISETLALDNVSNEYSPIELFDCLVSLAVSSVYCILFSIILHAMLNRYYWRFSNINPIHNKWKVAVNLMKGMMLAVICLNSKFLTTSFNLIHDKVSHLPIIELKRTSVLYIVTDLVGLLIVPRLPGSTKMHHIFTCLIGILIWSSNLRLPGWQGATGVAKLSLMYGMFSSIPYMVNIFIGLRVFVPKNKLTILVSFISLITYLICCSLNWSIHLYWLILCIINLDITVWGTFYTVALFYIIQDDIILIKFLVKFSFTDYDPLKEHRKKFQTITSTTIKQIKLTN